MTKDEHIRAHKQLHRSFDILIADFIMQAEGKLLTNTSLLDLIEWSYAQTLVPTLPAGAHYDEDLSADDLCPYAGCNGRMGFRPVENCSCHVRPPCSQCVENPLVCLACGWNLGDPTGPPSLLDACKQALAFFDKARVEEGDPLRALQDKFHGPTREKLREAIAREEGKA